MDLAIFVLCCDDVILIFVWGIFVLLCQIGAADVSAGCVMDVDFNDNS